VNGDLSPTSWNALEAYELREARREPASTFYARLAKGHGSDIDLEVAIRQSRKIHRGPKR
jgi:hypothetical protein